MSDREAQWSGLMRAASHGDSAAYERCLREIAQGLRPLVRRGLLRTGVNPAETEDVVQDILIAVHLKRQTWDTAAPFAPWLFAIARNKLIDALRRRGRRVFVDIDDFAETIAGPPDQDRVAAREVAAHLQRLPSRQRDVLQAIALDSASIKETATKLAMSEGAVRVALHRGLANLAARLRDHDP